MLDKGEIECNILNLKNKFAKKNPTWDGHELLTDPLKMGVIYSFITTYNIVFWEIERYTYLRNIKYAEILKLPWVPRFYNENE